MATCPHCRTSTRVDPDAMWIHEVIDVDTSLDPVNAELQRVFAAHSSLRLECRCGWHIDGKIADDQFLGDPTTQRFPRGSTGE